MLEHRGFPTNLSASDQLPALEGDLVSAGNFEAYWIIPFRLVPVFGGLNFRVQSQLHKGCLQTGADPFIAGQNPSSEYPVIHRPDNRVGQLISVQDCPAPSWPADQVPSALLDSPFVDLTHGLCITKGKAGWRPSVQPQDYRLIPKSHAFHEALVNGHVPGPGEVRGVDQPPTLFVFRHVAGDYTSRCAVPRPTCSAAGESAGRFMEMVNRAVCGKLGPSEGKPFYAP